MTKPRILIVEDERMIATIIKEVLTKKGYCITDIVATGEEAVEISLETRPDLILMDIKLKGKMDGITAYEQINKTVDIAYSVRIRPRFRRESGHRSDGNPAGIPI